MGKIDAAMRSFLGYRKSFLAQISCMIQAFVADMLTSIISVQNTTKGREKTNDDGRPCCALLVLGLLEEETHDCCKCLSEESSSDKRQSKPLPSDVQGWGKSCFEVEERSTSDRLTFAPVMLRSRGVTRAIDSLGGAPQRHREAVELVLLLALVPAEGSVLHQTSCDRGRSIQSSCLPFIFPGSVESSSGEVHEHPIPASPRSFS